MTRSAFSAARPHFGTLAPVAVAAAAEHHNEPVSDVGPQRIERLVESVGSVRIVDKDRRAMSRHAGQIEPPASATQIREHR